MGRMRNSNSDWGLSWIECSSLGLYLAACPGAGGIGLLVGGAVCDLFWIEEALVVGLDRNEVVSSVFAVCSGVGLSISLLMIVSLSFQVTDFTVSVGDVSFSVSTM